MRSDDELLTAYVDGVSELTIEERRRVEEVLARDPELRTEETATRGMLDRLRSLPPEGTEPDWTAMERAIRDEVGTTVPRPWWRAWRWLVPATALALAAAVFALWIQNRVPTEQPVIALPLPVPADAGVPIAPAAAEDTKMSLWLDGQEVAIDLDDAAMFEDDDDGLGEDDALTPGLLPVDNLAWIDELDVDDVEVAEAFLGRKKG